MPPVPPPPPLARPARSRTQGRSSAACCCAGTSSSMRRQRSSSRPPSRPRSRPVSPPGGRAGDRGFPAPAASRCPDNGSCPDPWNSSITPRIWRPRGRRGGAGWPAGEVLRMNLACRYVQAGVSTTFPQPFPQRPMACTGPLGAACMCSSLVGWQPDSASGPFAAYSGLERGPRGSRSDPLSPACRDAGVRPDSQAIANGWRAGRRRPA
jgi:hypothetical protein